MAWISVEVIWTPNMVGIRGIGDAFILAHFPYILLEGSKAPIQSDGKKFQTLFYLEMGRFFWIAAAYRFASTKCFVKAYKFQKWVDLFVSVACMFTSKKYFDRA